MIIYDLVADPTTQIVTLGEAKLHCKVDNDDDDPLITNLITASKKTFEKFANRSLFNQTWLASFDYTDFVKCKNYFLPYGKIQEVVQVATYDVDNNETIIDPSAYRTFSNRFIFNSNFVLPAYSNYRFDGAMELTWIAGLGETPSDIPQDIKQACLLLIRHWYENRGAIYEAVGGKSDLETLPLGVVDIFVGHRLFEL